MAATTEPVAATPSAFLPGQRRADPARSAGRRRPHAARRAARFPRHHVAQERLPAAGPVRLLHGADGRQAGAFLCASPGEGRRQIDHHARRARRRASPANRRFVRPLRRRAMRLLHSRHGDARRRAVRQEPEPKSRGNRHRTQAASVPLHRLRADRRQHRTIQPSCAAARRCPSRRPPTAPAASAPTCRATRATTPCSATASSSTT